ncbi:hypothetical protein V6N11_033942 [Hibiscus sabdariffa]|uniref:TOG domain-containing protein n=1 Tax=Hibiscus sabdariffa TaxID=183260 RepID=A0ABR2S114_9ROSI
MDIDNEIAKTQEERRRKEEELASLTSLTFDRDLYGGTDRDAYVTSIPVNDDDDANHDSMDSEVARKLASYTAPKSLLKEMPRGEEDDNSLGFRKPAKIIDREDEYRRRRLNQVISPDRHDAFASGEKTPDPSVRTYADVMREQALAREKEETLRAIAKKKKEEEEADKVEKESGDAAAAAPKRRNRWDQSQDDGSSAVKKAKTSDWDLPDATPGIGRWDATPTPGRVSDATPSVGRRNRWDETPTPGRLADSDATPAGGVTPGATPAGVTWDATPKGLVTPTPKRQRSRWDETPATMGSATPMAGSTPNVPLTPGVTPFGGTDLQTPTPSNLRGPMTPEQYNLLRWEKDIEERNRPLTDEELDAMFPQEGYKILEPPASYVPIRTPARKLLATPTPMGTPLYAIPEENRGQQFDVPKEAPGGLPFMKPEDYQYFGSLLNEENEDELSPEEQKERKIMKLLLKVKNGTPPQRKTALRQLTDKAREFGANALFNRILPLLMQPTLEDQERHLLVKVIDRVLYKLDELVRPYVHKILVVIEPLLIDEDYYARVEGREIISNLSKAAGLATMIAAMRPDIDNIDEYVRNTTARAFSVVASALGIPALLPFLKAVCQSKKSWQARHTGIKIVQQIAILIGCAVLPHLKSLVEIIEHGLNDENQKVRTITALSLAALAEAAAPYGIESFDSVLKPLWKGIRSHRGKVLAAFLKAIGFIIPLMDAVYASYYTKEVMFILIREFQSPDEEMKKIVLKVVKQCVSTEGVEAEYIRNDILAEFFRNFWVRRMALDRRNYRQLVETTVEMANKVGVADIVGRIVEDLKDESEPYRRMVMETIEKVVANLGASDIDARLEELLIDGILYAFQEQTSDDANVMLNGFGAVVNSLGQRVKPYLPQICGTIKWRLNNKSAKVRQQAADLISRIAVVMKQCQEEQLMGHLGVVLYEYLGEEYPEVLGSILGALKAIVNVIGMTKMTPPIKDLLPRLTPILKNRHEKVQENCIDLVGRIADRGAEFVPAREWMRICFELLEMLKAHKKGIRRATVNTFGYIAKAIGPQDVLATLLNNLKVQERQNRVCTTVAIAIVAETCSPFTVLPALMNEYRVPELNVQNGVLKSLSFLFEYIGEMGKDYIYAVTPLLEDALMDRDLVHRQTAASAVKHMALGVAGLGCEDALVHLLNYVWPNIFETSPHVINAVMEAIEGMRVALGAAFVLNYCLQGLFHPARKVREVYWKIYNSLYIGAQDALVAAYPILEDEQSSEQNNIYNNGGSFQQRNFFILELELLEYISANMGYEDAGDFTVAERLKTSIHANLIFYLCVGSLGLVGVILFIIFRRNWSGGILGFAMACSNTFGLVTGAFLLGFGLSEIPKGIWKNADWTTRQKVLSHKVAKMAVKLDGAHQEFSNAIVLKEDSSFKPQGGRFGENDMDYDTDEKSMASLRRRLRVAGEQYCRYRSEYMSFVLEALELEDTVKNYECRDATGWKFVSSFKPERTGKLGPYLDTIEFVWRCVLRKQLQRLLAVILGCMSAAILLAEATILPHGVDLSLFSILINSVGKKELVGQRMGNIDDAVPFFGKGFNKIYPLIMVVYTLLLVTNFFGRVIKYFGNWKVFKFQNEVDGTDGFNPSGLIILQKERSMLEQGHEVGEHVIPLARNFSSGSIGNEPGSKTTVFKDKSAAVSIENSVAELAKMGEYRPLKEELKHETSREANTKKSSGIRVQQKKQESNSNSTENESTSIMVDDGNSESVRTSLSGALASKWESMKFSLLNIKSNLEAKNFVALHQTQETIAPSHASSSKSLDEIFQKLKRPNQDLKDLDVDDDEF